MHQHSTLTHHILCKEHQPCLNILVLQKDLELSKVKFDSQQDKAALVLLKTTHLITQDGVPLSKFESINNFLTEIGIPDLLSLQQNAVAYRSRYAGEELLYSIVDTIQAALKIKVIQLPFVVGEKISPK